MKRPEVVIHPKDGPALAVLGLSGAFLAANTHKILDGGWFPLVIGIGMFTLMVTWRTGRRLMAERLKDDAKEEKRLVDATHGRRTRSIIVLDSNHVVLSAIQSETVSQRFAALGDSEQAGKE